MHPHYLLTEFFRRSASTEAQKAAQLRRMISFPDEKSLVK